MHKWITLTIGLGLSGWLPAQLPATRLNTQKVRQLVKARQTTVVPTANPAAARLMVPATPLGEVPLGRLYRLPDGMLWLQPHPLPAHKPVAQPVSKA